MIEEKGTIFTIPKIIGMSILTIIGALIGKAISPLLHLLSPDDEDG